MKSPARDPVPCTETWWLYLLECHGGVLYTGIAKDVDARFAAHLNGTGAIFTRLNRPLRILAKATMATKARECDCLCASERRRGFSRARREARRENLCRHLLAAQIDRLAHLILGWAPHM